jgi:WD40 repeat protein
LDRSKFHKSQVWALVHLFEVATGKELLVLRGHLTAVSALAFTPDERTLASGSTDGTVKLWSVETGQEMISRFFTHGTVADLKLKLFNCEM